MRLDLAFTLVDIPETGNAAWYQAAAKLMIASARAAYQNHDLRIIQMTDEASQVQEDIDIRFTPASKVERNELAQFRGHCTAEWSLQTDRPTILCDVDMLWNNDQLTDAFKHPTADIWLFERPHMEAQAFNGGLILTQPYQYEFWTVYREMMKTLPKDICGWWGDQIGLTAMVGTPEPDQKGCKRFGSTIGYLPAKLISPTPREAPSALIDAPVMHYKGKAKRKALMVDYFKLLQEKWARDADTRATA